MFELKTKKKGHSLLLNIFTALSHQVFIVEKSSYAQTVQIFILTQWSLISWGAWRLYSNTNLLVIVNDYVFLVYKIIRVSVLFGVNMFCWMLIKHCLQLVNN